MYGSQYMYVADKSGPYSKAEALAHARSRGLMMPSDPSDVVMGDAGFSRVVEVEAPTGDVVTQLPPVYNEEEQRWYQAWDSRDYTQQEREDIFTSARNSRLLDLSNLLTSTMSAGMAFQFADDRVEIMGLSAATLFFLNDSYTYFKGLPATGEYDPIYTVVKPQDGNDFTASKEDVVKLYEELMDFRKRVVYAAVQLREQILAVTGTDVSQLPMLPVTLEPATPAPVPYGEPTEPPQE